MLRGSMIVAGLVLLNLLASQSAWGQARVKAQSTTIQSAPSAPSRAQIRRVDAAPPMDATRILAIALADGPPRVLSGDDTVRLGRVIMQLSAEDPAAAEQEWKRFIAARYPRTSREDVYGLTEYVLHESYFETSEDLKFRADKVKFYNEQKRAAYDQRSRLRRMKRYLERSDATAETVQIQKLRLAPEFKPGEPALTMGEAADTDIDSVVDELAGIVVLCDHLEEEEQRASLELQAALQEQEQTLTTLSNASKMLHDTAMTIIRKMTR